MNSSRYRHILRAPGKRARDAYTRYRHIHLIVAHFPCPNGEPITSIHCTREIKFGHYGTWREIASLKSRFPSVGERANMAAMAPMMGTATNAVSLERAAGDLNVPRQAVCQFPLTGHEATRVTQRIRQQSTFDTKSIKLGHKFHRTIGKNPFFPRRTLSGSRSLPPDNGGGGLGGGRNGGGRSGGGGGGDGSQEPEDASNRSSHTNFWVK